MSLASFAALPIIDPNLAAEMNRMDDNEKIKINILLAEQANAMALLREAEFYSTKQEQRQFVVETLKQQAETAQYELLGLLNEMERNGMVNDIQAFWLVNCELHGQQSCHQRLGATPRHYDHLPLRSVPMGS
jgi:hypothetical protein